MVPALHVFWLLVENLHFESYRCLQGVGFGPLLACIFADPAEEIRFFLASCRYQMFFRSQMVSGTDFGRYLNHFWPLRVAFSGFFGRAILLVALCTFHIYTRYLAFYAFQV